MGVTSKIYPSCIESAFAGEIVFSTSRTKVMLLRDTYLYDSSHSSVLDMSQHEIVGEGYQAGGKLLSSVATQKSPNGVTFLITSPVLWENATITAKYAIAYDFASEKIISITDFGKNMSSSNAEFSLNWGLNGMFQIAIN